MSSASLPARQSSSQRRSAPSTQSSPSTGAPQSIALSSEPREDDTRAKDVITDETHTRLRVEDNLLGEDHATEETLNSEPARPSDAAEEEKKCWICHSDASEDTPETSPWRDPCPCALVAHEQCLLDWIADMDTSRNRARSIGGPHIVCPQCKGDIQLAQPRSYVVDVVRILEHWSARLVVPSAVVLLSGSLYHCSKAFGIHTIYALFGPDEGFRMLEPLLLDRVRPPLDVLSATGDEARERIFNMLTDHLTNWRLHVGLPLIMPALVLARTNLADPVLSTFPVAYIASHFLANQRDSLDFGSWPPNPALAFMTLPYLRAAYNAYYNAVWEEHEQRWIQEVLPPTAEGEDGGAAPAAVAGHGDVLVPDEDGPEVAAVFEEWEDDDGVPFEDAPQPQPGVPLDDNIPVADQAEQPAAAGGVAAEDNAGGRRMRRRLLFSPTILAESFIGALLFPSIANASGELLRVALPRSWTSSTTQLGIGGGTMRGLLQHRWGRSIVGGCLFVVLKDALMLYVRWKMAQMHRQRRVLDYDRSKMDKKGIAKS